MTRNKPQSWKKKLLGLVVLIGVVLIAGWFGIDLTGTESPPASERSRTQSPAPTDTRGSRVASSPAAAPSRSVSAALRQAIESHQSGVMVTLSAEVVRVLPDDDDGSRHQRLILELPEPIGDTDTVLIAHNIDLAPRVACDEGDVITVHGQYEWDDRGGVIHWTHHDPGQRREGGWIEHDGKRHE